MIYYYYGGLFAVTYFCDLSVNIVPLLVTTPLLPIPFGLFLELLSIGDFPYASPYDTTGEASFAV